MEHEFRDFLTCGVLAHGFARLRCADCAVERLVPFSCKGRGFCPNCGGRLMTESAARLVDEVLPQRLLKRRGLGPGDAVFFQADPVVEESPALAGISSASVQGRIALGPRAGARVWRVGDDPEAPWVLSTAPRHAHLAGFDLHATVAVPAADRTRLEHLCRYLLCPAVAQDRLRLLDDRRIVLTLETAWADGTRQLVFEPLECRESWRIEHRRSLRRWTQATALRSAPERPSGAADIQACSLASWSGLLPGQVAPLRAEIR